MKEEEKTRNRLILINKTAKITEGGSKKGDA